jgi:hypothetical protein
MLILNWKVSAFWVALAISGNTNRRCGKQAKTRMYAKADNNILDFLFRKAQQSLLHLFKISMLMLQSFFLVLPSIKNQIKT